jgi:hypothetical protein
MVVFTAIVWFFCGQFLIKQIDMGQNLQTISSKKSKNCLYLKFYTISLIDFTKEMLCY